ncbi:hypothetical protein HPB50_004792 [Hyalomma asiaticum]|uniref:Uncharacterized protein n=1 Tax=Hyalomma asiaticum TaxID=266040 RepID=A0ACB7SN74_HYAAI|nr:hypothetical protein HPB50_004792 [Hyalomma asiaticum]
MAAETYARTATPGDRSAEHQLRCDARWMGIRSSSRLRNISRVGFRAGVPITTTRCSNLPAKPKARFSDGEAALSQSRRSSTASQLTPNHTQTGGSVRPLTTA